jgi:hypothetical protein
MVELRPPHWYLRRDCPVCEQRGLLLVACPDCAHVAAICAEEGAAFQSASAIASELAADPESVHCPHCAGPLLSAFTPATSNQILAAGLGVGDYE